MNCTGLYDDGICVTGCSSRAGCGLLDCPSDADRAKRAEMELAGHQKHLKMQPRPTQNDSEPIVEKVIADLRERAAVGLAKYGTLLQAFNGRDALQDGYEETLDFAQYLKQAMVERDELVEQITQLTSLLEKHRERARTCYYCKEDDVI